MENRFEIIRQAAENKNFDIDYCFQYGEFGYELSEGKKAILGLKKIMRLNGAMSG